MNPVSFPDPVLMVRDRLLRLGVNVVNRTTASFGTPQAEAWERLPLIQVDVIPGGSTDLYGYSLTAAVDLNSYAATWDDAYALAQKAHAIMCATPGASTPHGVFDDVRVATNPGELNYSNPGVNRFLATYDVTVRSV